MSIQKSHRQKSTFLTSTNVPVQIFPDPGSKLNKNIKKIERISKLNKISKNPNNNLSLKNSAYKPNSSTLNTEKIKTKPLSHQTYSHPKLNNFNQLIKSKILNTVIIFLIFISLAGIYFSSDITVAKSLFKSGTEKIKITPVPTKTEIVIKDPTRIKIPSIKVNAQVQEIGLTPNGALDVPSNSKDVGWYKLGPRPGEKGSAVIDGHFDDSLGLPAVFNKLNTLKKGDIIIVENDSKKQLYFIVNKIESYSSSDQVSAIFNDKEGKHLNLITCNGTWDSENKNYTQRLVIFADLKEI